MIAWSIAAIVTVIGARRTDLFPLGPAPPLASNEPGPDASALDRKQPVRPFEECDLLPELQPEFLQRVQTKPIRRWPRLLLDNARLDDRLAVAERF